MALLDTFKSCVHLAFVDIRRLNPLLDYGMFMLWKFVFLLCRDLVDLNVPLNILFQRF